MSSAIFLDRDGVINRERKDYVKSLDEFEIFDGVAEAIRLFKENNFLVIIITNQSAINRRLLSVKTLNHIHSHFMNYLKKNSTSIDGIYYCPHIPEDSCDCRKPKPGLILRAASDFNINLEKSWMIGNTSSDIEAAIKAGCNWIFMKKDQTLLEITRTFLHSVETFRA